MCRVKIGPEIHDGRQDIARNEVTLIPRRTLIAKVDKQIRHTPRPYAKRPLTVPFDLLGRVNRSAVFRAVGKFLQQGKVRAIRIEPGYEIPFASQLPSFV